MDGGMVEKRGWLGSWSFTMQSSTALFKFPAKEPIFSTTFNCTGVCKAE